MRAIVTLSGIDEAIDNLGYTNEKHIKTKVIRTLRQFYSDENSVGTVVQINSEDLIKLIWDTDNSSEAIKNKRKNFSSIKSSINSELTRLHSEGKNPEGIVIGKNNTFDMSEKAKSELLENFAGSGDGDSLIPLGKINDFLGVINDILKINNSGSGIDPLKDQNSLDQLKDLIQSISQKIGLSYSPDQIPELSNRKSHTYGKGDGGETGSGEEGGKGLLTQTSQDKSALKEPGATIEASQTGHAEGEEVLKASLPYAGAGLQEKKIKNDIEKIDGANDLVSLDESEGDIEEIDELPAEETDDDIKEVEVAEDLEELESGESPENELEEVEELETDEIPDDEVEEIDVQEVPEDELEELKYPGDAEKLESEVDYIKNERILADEFNNMLSEMDRYYNQYILIPKGSYIIGGKDLKRNGRTSENVDIKTFYFGKFPVTNALFEIFIEKTGYITTAERTGHGTVYYGRYQNIVDDRTGLKTLNWNSAIEARLIEGACWYQPAGPGSTLYNKRNHPVVQVSLEDAKAFAKWTGKRIPTEAQWEAATRTLKGYTFPWGKENKTGCCNIEDSCIGDTTPVDKYPGNENSLGIMDILGNVMEWTIDNNQPSAGEKHNPLHILKGGSWISGNDLSLYDRSFSEPGVTSNILGFRCIVC